MLIRGSLVFAAFVAVATSGALAQAPPPSAASGPTFDVVSIKRNTTNDFGSKVIQRPDGGFTMLNIPIGTLVARAYGAAPVDMVGLPGWAMSERYDVSATSLLSSAMPEQRTAMLRSMLADRFKLAVHVEQREEAAYDLVLARSDGRLGSGIKPSEGDCVAKQAAERAAAESGKPLPPPPGVFDRNAPPPPCTLRFDGNRMEGDTTMDGLVRLLRAAAGRYIVDRTGLAGSYRLTLTYDGMAARRGPDAAPAADAPPSVFTALPEQLGLKLESSKATRDTLVIDRIDRPTDN